MKSIKSIRDKIKTTEIVKKIVSTAELMSSKKLKRYFASLDKSRKYLKTCEDFFSIITKNNDTYPIYQNKKILLVIMGSDKSLCGSYNIKLSNTIMDEINKNKNDFKIICIGKQLTKKIDKKNILCDFSFNNKKDSHSEYCSFLVNTLENTMLKEKCNICRLIYTKYHSNHKQTVICKNIIPVGQNYENNNNNNIEIETIEDECLVLEKIESTLLHATFFHAYINCFFSEHSSRVASMGVANKNCDKILKKTNTEYNKKRQLIITNELIEIISGSIIINKF